MTGFAHLQGASSQTNLRRLVPIMALLAALALPESTTQAVAQTQPAPDNEDTSSLPQPSDFTPPYTCPWFFGRPASCNTPIKVSLECVDIRTIPADQLSRPFTDQELRNADKACELLPKWIDQDPRIIVVSEEYDVKIKHEMIPSNKLFSSTRVYIGDNNFKIVGSLNRRNEKASRFAENSLIEISKKGYLP
jgi:hypothetical protein